MGNETFYCVQCGVRVRGLDIRGDRSHCPACLPPEPAAQESSKRLRRPSSGALVAVAARPRATTKIMRPRRSRTLLLGGLSLAGAALVALAPLLSSRPGGPTSTVIIAPAREAKPDPTPSPLPPSATKLPGSFVATPDPGTKKTVPFVPVTKQTVYFVTDPAVEAMAREIEEAATVLADEGRFEDALSRIRAFLDAYPGSRAGAGLDGLRRQIEARARLK